jgi:ABC-type multidrug transport system ATPase subunit
LLAVDARDLSKTFETKQEPIEAVEDVSLAVTRGEIFIILGPNGAGKSTMILILVTLFKPTGGSAQILGFDIDQEDVKIRTKIGVALQETGLDRTLTGQELLQSTARLGGMGFARHSVVAGIRLGSAQDVQAATFYFFPYVSLPQPSFRGKRSQGGLQPLPHSTRQPM